MLYIAIDPGKWKAGLAVGDTELRHAETVYIPRPRTPNPKGELWRGLAPKLVLAVKDHLRLHEEPPPPRIHVIQETPQDYPGKPRREEDLQLLRDFNDRVWTLLQSELGGAFGSIVTRRRATPHTWKAGVPKEVHHRRVVQELSHRERDLCRDLNHDGWDAVAMYLWGCGRLGRGGAAPT